MATGSRNDIFKQPVEQDAGGGPQTGQHKDQYPQWQDQVEARQRKDRDADQRPERMIAVGRVDAVEGAAVPLADVLRDFEVVIGIIAREPFVGQVIGVGKGGVAIDAQQGEHDGNTSNQGRRFSFAIRFQGAIQYPA